jgi:hypothetical protein
MSDLDRLHQCLAPPRLKEITRFREVGVSPEALSAPELPARADVVFHDDRPLFDFADDAGDGRAVAGFIFLARDDEGDPCDLVAWSPQAKRIAAWYGVAPLLGTDMLYAPRLDPEGALQVFEEPLALGDRRTPVRRHRLATIRRAQSMTSKTSRFEANSASNDPGGALTQPKRKQNRRT